MKRNTTSMAALIAFGLCALFATGAPAFSPGSSLNTKYVVKISNKSGHKIKVIYAKYKISTWEKCQPFNGKKIKKNKTRSCKINNVSAENTPVWRIRYKCNKKRYQKTSRKSWADRRSNGGKIVVSFKIGSDCKASKNSSR